VEAQKKMLQDMMAAYQVKMNCAPVQLEPTEVIQVQPNLISNQTETRVVLNPETDFVEPKIEPMTQDLVAVKPLEFDEMTQQQSDFQSTISTGLQINNQA
jgi:hypothetical protein